MTRKEQLINEIVRLVQESYLQDEPLNEGWIDNMKKSLIPIILSTIGLSGESTRILSEPSVQNKIEQHRDEIVDQAVERGFDSRSAEEVLDSILNVPIEEYPFGITRRGFRVHHINRYFERKQLENYSRYKKAIQEEAIRYQRVLKDLTDKYHKQTGSTTPGYLDKMEDEYEIDVYTQADLNQDREEIDIEHEVRVGRIEAEFNETRNRLIAEREDKLKTYL